MFLVTWMDEGILFKMEFESFTKADEFYVDKLVESCDIDKNINDINLYQKLKNSKLLNLY